MALYHDNLELIERVIALTVRRHALKQEDADDFTSYAHLKLLEHNGRILATYQGRSHLRAFLVTVIGRLYQDFRNHRWGKWRPSAEARRQGELAVLLETLMVRDQYSLDQALEIIVTNHGVQASREQLERIAADFPKRTRLRIQAETDLERSEGDLRADGSLMARERRALRRHVVIALNRILDDMVLEDRLILKLHFHDSLPLSKIAKRLSLDQRPLYRRLEKILNQLRAELERQGLTVDKAREVIGDTFDVISQVN